MSLTAEQMAYLNANINSHQRFEARWWVFPMDAMTISAASSPGALAPNPMPILQPRFGVLRANEAQITLDASGSYEFPSSGSYTAVTSYAWSISSGPGTISGSTTSSTCVVNIPASDTVTVVKVTVTDSSAATTDAYGRYIRPATSDTGLARSINLSGSYSAHGWTADLTIMDDLTNIVSGDPLNNLAVIEMDRYWNGTMSNFNPLYTWRPELAFVGFIEGFEQYEESGHYYTTLHCATSQEYLYRYQNPSQRLYYHNTDFGADHWYVDPLRLVDIGWDTILDVTNYVQYYGNVYFWPETQELGPERYGRLAAMPRALWEVLGDTVAKFAGDGFCTAQNDVYFSQEPGLITWRQNGGPLADRGYIFDEDSAGPLTEEYLAGRKIIYRQPECSQLTLQGERRYHTYTEDVYADSGAVTNQGRHIEMSGFAVTGGEEIGWLVTDIINRFNRDYDIECEAMMFPVVELAGFLDITFDDEQQTGGTSQVGTNILEVDDIFWISDISHQISFDVGSWLTRFYCQQVTEQNEGGH